jgi:hypothetical protein
LNHQNRPTRAKVRPSPLQRRKVDSPSVMPHPCPPFWNMPSPS